MKELQKAIVDTYNSDPWLAAHTSGCYFNQAPDNTGYPYGIFYTESSFQYVQAGIAQKDVTLRFNLFDDDSSSETINNYMGYVMEAFNNTDIGISGHTVTRFPRADNSTIFQVNDDMRDVWQCTLQFQLSYK